MPGTNAHGGARSATRATPAGALFPPVLLLFPAARRRGGRFRLHRLLRHQRPPRGASGGPERTPVGVVRRVAADRGGRRPRPAPPLDEAGDDQTETERGRADGVPALAGSGSRARPRTRVTSAAARKFPAIPPRRPKALVPPSNATPKPRIVQSKPGEGVTVVVAEAAAIRVPAAAARTVETVRASTVSTAAAPPRRHAGSPRGRYRPSARRNAPTTPKSPPSNATAAKPMKRGRAFPVGSNPPCTTTGAGCRCTRTTTPAAAASPAAQPGTCRITTTRPRRSPPTAAAISAGAIAATTPRSPWSAKCSADATATGPIARFGAAVRRLSPAASPSSPIATRATSSVSNPAPRNSSGRSRCRATASSTTATASSASQPRCTSSRSAVGSGAASVETGGTGRRTGSDSSWDRGLSSRSAGCCP